MPYIVPTFEQTRDKLLRDLKNLRPDVDISSDSDWYIRATSVASCAEGLYAHQGWIVKQIFPDTADTEYLELHAALKGLNRKPAVAASGTITLTGEAGREAPAGLEAKAVDGRVFVTTASTVIDETGSAAAAAAAAVAGVAGNTSAGATLTLGAAPLGIDSRATVVSMLGGVERETHTELLARLLEIIRRPPAGGNKYDFRRWAMEVPGVTNAFAYPLRRGLGTIDVAVISGSGLPSEDILQAVRDHIEDVRPVAGKSTVIFAPTERFVDLSVKVALKGLTLAEAEVNIGDVLQGQFGVLSPGETWIRSQAEALISNIAGVTDRQILAPGANVVPVVDAEVVEWLRRGTLTVEAME